MILFSAAVENDAPNVPDVKLIIFFTGVFMFKLFADILSKL